MSTVTTIRNLAAEIDGYDRRDARHSIPENDWRQVGRFGKPSLYGWSEDKARQVYLKGRISEHSFAARVSSWISEPRSD
jgi:hypothetical protein